jgi:hypothetical protein
MRLRRQLMSDECKHCDLRGRDRKLCTSDAGLGSFCSVPESWYVGELLRENKDLLYQRGCLDDAIGEHILEERGLRREIGELRVLAKSSIENGDAIMAELVTAMKKCVELDKENAHLWRIVKAAGDRVAEIRDSIGEDSHE